MSSKLKKWCYWLSLVGPVYDILRGAIIGIYNVHVQLKTAREYEKATKYYDQQLEQFRKDNSND